MIEADQRTRAREQAETYAPKPRDNRWIYGLVTASVALLAVLAASWFYEFPIENSPLLLAAVVMAAFGAGLLIRSVQLLRHDKAVGAELRKTTVK